MLLSSASLLHPVLVVAVKSYSLVIFNLFYLVYIEFILCVLSFPVTSWKISGKYLFRS